jgi:MerR family transcriptional regulator, light-induced transcriptional regulator
MAGADELTLQEVADLLGVHYMTAYRYVRLGRLPARKQGGTWRVAAADVAALRPAGAGRRGRRGGNGIAPHWTTRLESRLVAGDAAGAEGVVDAALAGGCDLGEIYLHALVPALRSIGERWAADDLDIADEHRASTVTQELLGRVTPRFVRPGRRRAGIVLGAAPGERHGLPVTIVAHLLRLDGWAVDDLGPDVPAASFVVAATAVSRLIAVGVSVTDEANLSGAEAALSALRSGLDGQADVLVGGLAVRDADHARALGADRWAPDAAGAAALIAELAAARRER